MKNTYYLVALSALLLGACTNDDDLTNRDHPALPTQNGRVELKFDIGGVASGVVSYAEGPIATEPESKMETLDIYVFGEDTLPNGQPKVGAKMLLEEIFKSELSEGITLAPKGEKYEGTISVLGKNKKVFYFVANGRDIRSLQDFAPGVTDTTVFNRKVTDPVPGKITCPLLMTAVDSIKMDTLKTTDKLPVELKRVVARFDIVNYAADADFIIKDIQIKQSRPQAYVFPNAEIYNGGKPIEDFLYDSELIDFSSATNANAGLTPSAFYMYPSPIADKGMVRLGGKSLSGGGLESVYEIHFQKNQDHTKANDLDIQANKRYVVNIIILGTNVMKAGINVEDWGLNDTIPVAGGYGSLGVSLDPAATSIDGVSMDSTTLILPAEPLSDAIKIFVQASSKWKVVTAEDWLEVADPSDVDAVAPFFTIKSTLANVNRTTEREGRVVIQNITRPSITQTLVVKQVANPTTYIDVTAKSGLHNGVLVVEGKTTSCTLQVDAGGSDWTPSTPTSWITGLTASQETRTVGDNTLKVVLEANLTDIDREGTIVLTIDETHKRTITVKQAKRNLGAIDVTIPGLVERTLSIIPEGKGIAVTIKALSEWEITETYDKSWVTVGAFTSTIDAFSGTIPLTIAANPTPKVRETIIRIQNKANPADIHYEFTVSQAGVAVTMGDIDPVSIPAAGVTDGTIVVTSNDTWTVSMDPADDWITAIAPGTDANEGKIVYSASENTGTSERVATITVTSETNPEIKKTFTITQAGAVSVPVTLSVDKPTVTMNQDGSSSEVVTVSVSEGSWNIGTTGNDTNWLTIAEDKGANTLTLTTPAANATETPLEAVITVTGDKDGSKTASITVTQPGTAL